MHKDILVPLDGSPLGERALPLGAAIARRSGGTLRLAHVHAPLHPVYIEGLPVIDEEGRATHRLHEQAYLDSVQRRLANESGLTVKTALLEGDAAAALSSYAADSHIGLIVMTTHGRSGLARAWLGSVADTLVRSSPVPLLLIRADEEESATPDDWNCERILVLLDGSALAEQVLNPVEYVSKLLNAQVILLSVVQPAAPITNSVFPFGAYIPTLPDDSLEETAHLYLGQIAERLEREGISTTTRVVVSAQVAPRILETVNELDVGLIAMTTRGHSGLRRMLLGSVADKVLRGAEAPLLLCSPTMPMAD